MRSRRGDRAVSPWPLLIALALLVAVLATLLWLRDRLVEGQDALVEGTVRRFEATDVLGRPESARLLFADVETLAGASTGGFIREVRVTKVLRDRGEVTVHPFHADLSDADWREEQPWTRLPVGREPDGYLYLLLNSATLRAVDSAIAVVAFLLAGGFGFLVLRQRRKEARLSEVIHELEANKAQIIQLERLALAGQLSANIFHDIKKPVLNIKHEINDYLDGDDRRPEEVLQLAADQTGLFLEMLRDIGMESFVNARTDEEEWCSLPEVVERSLRLVRYEQGGIAIKTSYDPPGDSFLLKAAPHRLVQLFSNLALNAFQAMGEEGELRLAVRREGGGIVARVEDSGPGIPPGIRDELFSPFVTSRAGEGGSGLGLYISRSIVEDLGGTLRIARAGELGGACFEAAFPAAADGETGGP